MSGENWGNRPIRGSKEEGLMAIGFIIIFSSAFLWSYYLDTLPHSPEPATHKVFPLHHHEKTVYATVWQSLGAHFMIIGGFAIVALGGTLETKARNKLK